MNKSTKKQRAKTKPIKTHRIDVRFTEDEYKTVVERANECGMCKSQYLHDLGIGHQPKRLMTEEQEEALKGLKAVRSDCMGFTNAFNGLSQKDRIKMFKREDIMHMWMEGIKRQIEEFNRIRHLFE